MEWLLRKATQRRRTSQTGEDIIKQKAEKNQIRNIQALSTVKKGQNKQTSKQQDADGPGLHGADAAIVVQGALHRLELQEGRRTKRQSTSALSNGKRIRQRRPREERQHKCRATTTKENITTTQARKVCRRTHYGDFWVSAPL